MVLPALAAAKLAGIPGNVNKYLRSESNVVKGMTKGERAWGYGLWIVLGIFFFAILLAVWWATGGFEDSSIAPNPMHNTRVSKRDIGSGHKEMMFSNRNMRRRNSYKRQHNKTVGGDEFGGYYGIHPRGFSQGEPRQKYKIGQTMEIDPGGTGEEEEDDFIQSVKKVEQRNRKRLSKSMNTGSGVNNTGHIQQVSEINTATNLSSSSDFKSAFGRNSGYRNINRYIQPLEPRGVSRDALNFASITK